MKTIADSEKSQLFKRQTFVYYPLMYKMAFARLLNREDAEDAVQESYLKAYRSFHTFNHDTNLKAWIMTVLINTIKDQFKKPVNLFSVPIDTVNVESALSTPSTEQLICESEIDTGLLNALNSIPEIFRTPLLLRELQSFSYNEIAHIMNIPTGTVMSRIARAREQLRNNFKNHSDKESQKTGSTGSAHKNRG